MTKFANSIRVAPYIGLLFALFLFGHATVIRSDTCSDFQRGLLASGVSVPGACGRPVDTKILSGGCANPYEAKEFLKKRSEKPGSIEGLQPEFACNLMKLIQAVPPQLGQIRINVGVYQVTASVATHGVSYCQHYQCKEGTNSHPRGLAADLLYNGNKGPGGNAGAGWCQQNALCNWTHTNAQSFGLQFRLMPQHPCRTGYTEPWHIELKGTGCSGDNGAYAGNTSGAPLSLGDTVRGLLGGEQKTPPVVSQPAIPTQLAHSQSPIQAFQEPVAITSGIINTNTNDNSNENTEVTGVSSQIGGTTRNTAHATTAADRLEELAFGVGTNAVAGSIATSVPLIVSGSSTVGITSPQNPTGNQQYAVSQISSSQQTFFSGDLSWQSGSSFSSGPVTGWEAILITIKATLEKIMQYFQPFGARTIPEARD